MKILTALACIVIMALGASSASANWEKVALPAPFDNHLYLDVFFLPSNPSLGWACSITGGVVRTNDSGKTWSGVVIPDGGHLEYIQFLNANTGYVSGTEGLWRSDNGGATWRRIWSPLIVSIDGVQSWGSYFISVNEGVLFAGSGCDRQLIYRTVDGGQTWSFWAGNFSGSKLSDGYIYPDNTGWAIGSGMLYSTSDRGVSWQPFASTDDTGWHEELAIAGRTMAIPVAGRTCSGDEGGEYGAIRASTDGGRTWNNTPTGAPMYGTFMLDERNGWAAGSNERVLYTTDAGRTWTPDVCGLEGASLDDIFFIDSTFGWVVGEGIFRWIPDTVAPPLITQGPPDSLCAGDEFTLSASEGFDSYEWSNGSRTRSITVSQPGTYSVRAYHRRTCSYVEASLAVSMRTRLEPSIKASAGTVLCEGETTVLDAGAGFDTYLWSDGSTSQTITVSRTGTYSVTVGDLNGCSGTSEPVAVTVNPRPSPSITVFGRTTICQGFTTTLDAGAGYASYLWSTGEQTRTIEVGAAGKYTVTVTNEAGCEGTGAEVEITVIDDADRLEIVGADIDTGRLTWAETDRGVMACKTVVIRNRKDSPTVISKAWFGKGDYWFLPPSQLPLPLAPNEEKLVTLCFEPLASGLLLDSLIVPDVCTDQLLRVQGSGKLQIAEATSRCVVPMVATALDRASTALMSNPWPNPATASDNVTIEVLAPAADALDGVSVELVSSVGGLRLPASWLSVHVQPAASGSSYLFTVGFSAPNPAPGAWFVVLRSANYSAAIPLMIY